jgi:hypothetical protein
VIRLLTNDFQNWYSDLSVDRYVYRSLAELSPSLSLTGRVCYGIELYPNYVDVIVKWQQMSHFRHFDSGVLCPMVWAPL